MQGLIIVLLVLSVAILWIIGEAADRPLMRRIAAPLFTAMIATIAYVAATLGTSFNDSIEYSGATKEFISAVVSAIDRGDTEAAHAELRRFDSVSIVTYEGGAFLEWLREPVKRLSPDATMEAASPAEASESSAETPVDEGG